MVGGRKHWLRKCVNDTITRRRVRACDLNNRPLDSTFTCGRETKPQKGRAAKIIPSRGKRFEAKSQHARKVQVQGEFYDAN